MPPTLTVSMVDLDVRHTAQYGRGLYTRGSIVCGTEVHREGPFVHVLTRSQQGVRCDWCLTESQSLSRCARCKSTQYCGVNCQKNDWSQHKAECKGIAAIKPHAPTDTMRLLVRALQKRHGLAPGTPWEMDSLSSVKDSLNVESKEKVAEQLLGVKAILRGEFEGPLAYEVICKLLCNTFNICDGEMAAVGAGVYINCSLLNHSCDPNCVVHFIGTVATVRAIKDIAAGDQLFISYVDLVDGHRHRRAHLKNVYGFVCLCGRCLREDGEEDESSSAVAELKRRENLKDVQDWEGILCCNRLSPLCTRVTAVKESELVYDAQIGLGKWEDAADTASKLVSLYRGYLFPYHPLIGLSLIKLGKLQRLVCDLKASIVSLTEAAQCLSISHGSTHPLTRQAREMLADSRSELQNMELVVH